MKKSFIIKSLFMGFCVGFTLSCIKDGIAAGDINAELNIGKHFHIAIGHEGKWLEIDIGHDPDKE